MSRSKDTYVFKGKTHRVQLVVYDFTGDDIPPAVKESLPKFCVRSLPLSDNVYKAFSLGRQDYYGDDPDAAWDHIKRYIPDLFRQAPEKLRLYMVKWGDTRRASLAAGGGSNGKG